MEAESLLLVICHLSFVICWASFDRFVRSFVRSFARQFVRSFVRSERCSTVPLLHCSIIPPRGPELLPLGNVPLLHCFTRSLFHCSTAPLLHSFTVSLSHFSTAPLLIVRRSNSTTTGYNSNSRMRWSALSAGGYEAQLEETQWHSVSTRDEAAGTH